MDTEKILLALNTIMGNYEKFVEIAVELPWFPVEEQHDDWCNTYPLGILADMVHFPKGYVETNFLEAFVRAEICAIAYADKWDKDFFDISKEERKKCLCSERAKLLYGGIVNYNYLRLETRTEEYLCGQVNYYAGENGISLEEQEKYLAYVKDATILELGGCYCGDFSYLVVKGDTLLLIDCGIWD